MRKNYKIAVLTMAMAVMMAATACSSKDNTETTAAETTAETRAETTKAGDTTTAQAGATEKAEDESKKEADESGAEAEAPEAGSVEGGVFKSAAGAYQITPPEGWTIDGDSDESVAVFTSKEGNGFLEITYAEGEEADGAREVYPDTVEEYKDRVSRGEDMEFVRYEVKNGDNGSQIFRYGIRYTNPEDGIHYYAVSGSYDGAAKKYIMAAGTLEAEGEDLRAAVEKSLDSLVIN